jgi:hypothetical protein
LGQVLELPLEQRERELALLPEPVLPLVPGLLA